MQTVYGLMRLFVWNSKIRLQRGMEYRFDFISGIILSTLSSSIPPLFQYFLFTQTKGYPGWSLNQVILFQGMLLIIVGLRNTMFGEVRNLILDYVRKGNLDRLLLKPYSPIGIILASGFNVSNLGTLLAGSVISVYSLSLLKSSIGLLQILLALLSVISGLIFYTSILVFYCAITLMIVNMGGIWDLFQNLLDFASYPKEIFPKLVGNIFITIFPFMVMVYYPTQILLNRYDIKLFFAFLASIVIFLISIVFWNNCMKKYTSAGG